MTLTDRESLPSEPQLPVGAHVTPAPGVVFAEVDGETVLLDGRSGVYYGLNQTGSRLWTFVLSGASIGEIHDALLAEYDVPSDVVAQDVGRIVGELVEAGLVYVASNP